MTLPDVLAALLYVAVLWIPGGLMGAAAGLRGWTLAAGAPLLSYALAGLGGPWLSALGVQWSPLTFGLLAIGAVVVVACLRWLLNRRQQIEPTEPAELAEPAKGFGEWSRAAHLAVAGCVAAATAVGIAVVLGGIRTVSAIPQDLDAAFHANGVRWIAETGDGGLFAMRHVDSFSGQQVFYPNAYHLVAATVYRLTGVDIPTTLNLNTILIPGLAALALVALIRRMGGRAVFAGATALVVVAASPLYDLLWRGPLLPFAVGVALTPLVVVLMLDFLDATGWRAKILPGLVFALGVAGLVCIHPSMSFGALIIMVPVLVMRWWRAPSRLRAEPAALAVTAVAVLAVGYLQVSALRGAVSGPEMDWPAELSVLGATRNVLSFGHGFGGPQWVLAAALLIGVLRYHRLGELRWIGVVAVVFGVLFVIAASSDATWANSITRPWWNDRWRLAALTGIPLCVIAGHGLAELQRFAAMALRRLPGQGAATAKARPVPLRAATAGLAVLLVFAIASGGLYLQRNTSRMANNIGDGPGVTPQEVVGMEAIAQIVPPGARVLNDRGDGSVWMYALAGVRPVAAFYDGTLSGPDAALLASSFNQYDHDPAVQASVQRLNVEYVMLGTGFLRPWQVRQPGLTNLGDMRCLQEAYRNSDVVLYRLICSQPAATATTP